MNSLMSIGEPSVEINKINDFRINVLSNATIEVVNRLTEIISDYPLYFTVVLEGYKSQGRFYIDTIILESENRSISTKVIRGTFDNANNNYGDLDLFTNLIKCMATNIAMKISINPLNIFQQSAIINSLNDYINTDSEFTWTDLNLYNDDIIKETEWIIKQYKTKVEIEKNKLSSNYKSQENKSQENKSSDFKLFIDPSIKVNKSKRNAVLEMLDKYLNDELKLDTLLKPGFIIIDSDND